MPCLPKILQEKGVIRSLKQCLGMGATDPGISYGSDLKPGKYGRGSKYNADVSYRILGEERDVPPRKWE